MKSYLLAATLLTCTCLPAYAITIFNDGSPHNIDGSGPFDQVVVSNSTTANVLSGANVVAPDTATGSVGIYVSDSSIVNMFGGIISGGDDNYLGGLGGNGISSDDSTVNIDGGTVNGGQKDYLTGGGFGGTGLWANDSLVNISGGTFNGGFNTDSGGFGGLALELAGDTIANVSGGIFNEGFGGALSQGSIQMVGSSILNLSGGFLSGHIQMLYDSVLNVYGSGLAYGGAFSNITGTLVDGTPINAQIYQMMDSQVNLYEVAVAVPEPSIIALFGLGLAGLGFARRRQS